MERDEPGEVCVWGEEQITGALFMPLSREFISLSGLPFWRKSLCLYTCEISV